MRLLDAHANHSARVEQRRVPHHQSKCEPLPALEPVSRAADDIFTPALYHQSADQSGPPLLHCLGSFWTHPFLHENRIDESHPSALRGHNRLGARSTGRLRRSLRLRHQFGDHCLPSLFCLKLDDQVAPPILDDHLVCQSFPAPLDGIIVTSSLLGSLTF